MCSWLYAKNEHDDNDDKNDDYDDEDDDDDDDDITNTIIGNKASLYDMQRDGRMNE